MGSAYNPDGKSSAHAFFPNPVCVLVSHATGHIVPKSDGKFGGGIPRKGKNRCAWLIPVSASPKSDSTDRGHDSRANISGSGRPGYT
jgi:hypothetical protein